MNLLLDTCTFLWYTGQTSKLSEKARDLCIDPDNTLFLSSVSAWEIELKYRAGRLDMDTDPRIYIPEQRRNHQIFELPFEEEAALQYGTLPNVHRDPFDRMLICQALDQDLTLLTPDRHIQAYPVKTAW